MSWAPPLLCIPFHESCCPETWQPGTISSHNHPPIPPAYLWCQRRMSLQVCTFQLQHLGEEPSAQSSGIWTAGQGSWLPRHLSSRPGPLTQPRLPELWTEPDRTALESTNSGSLGQPVLGVFISEVLGVASGQQVSEPLETLPSHLMSQVCLVMGNHGERPTVLMPGQMRPGWLCKWAQSPE